MRLIGSIPNQQQAELLAAWMIAERIEVQVDQNGSQWDLWAKDEDQMQAARQAYEEFMAEPGHARYLTARERAAAIIQERRQRRSQFAKNYVEVRRQRAAPVRAPLTWTLIAISALIALTTSFGQPRHWTQPPFSALAMLFVGPPQGEELLARYADDGGRIGLKFTNVASGQVWRLITPIFLHFGTMHLVFNMVILYQLGRIVEARYGAFRFGLMVLLIAATSNFVQTAVPESWGGMAAGLMAGHLLIALGGMSGVCYGLFGFVWVKSYVLRSSGFFLPQSSIVIMLGWLFFCMSPWSQDILGHAVANWAHGIGLLVGMALAYFTILASRMRS